MAHADIVHYVQTTIAALSGMAGGVDYPPESINQFPFVVTWIGPGTVDTEPAGVMLYLEEVVIQLHVARVNLPQAVALLTPFLDSVPNALLADVTLGGTVVTISGPITHSGIATFDWAGEKHNGIEFRVPIKLHPIIS